jgi:hypothetical protein
MLKTIRYRNKTMAQLKELDALAPKTGDLAPDFELQHANGQESVRLSDYRGQKPVALIFGSYT